MIRSLCWLLPLALTTACLDATDDETPAENETAAAVTTTAFTATYTGQGAGASTCNTTYAITGQEPTTTGKYPLFIYTVGTNESPTNASATAAVAAMASRGFVAATVAYDSPSFGSCTALTGKTKCIYNAASTTSAVAKLCARAKADCSKGIVVGGFSQGSLIATLAKNYDTRVQAAWGIGDGVQYSIYNLASCVGNGNRSLPSSRLRVVDGERDVFIGPTAANVRSQMLSLTGYSCTGYTCLQSNGAGWYIIQNAQVGDGSADHCYTRTGDCSGSQNSIDATWKTGTAAWTLNANLDWLASFTSP